MSKETGKRGRPVVAGSARQSRLDARAQRAAQGLSTGRGRPANQTSARQAKLAAMVFTHIYACESAHVIQRAWRAVGTSLRSCTIELFRSRFWDSFVWAEDVPHNQALERGVMRSNLPP